MRFLYTLLVFLSLPLVIARLYIRSIKAPAYRQRWLERLGYFQPPESTGGLWVHAVSVGEVQAIAPLVCGFMESHPDMPVCITTTTPTGSERVKGLFEGKVFHVYLPYDLPFALKGFFKRVSPRMLLMVETEIWPNLLTLCEVEGIKTLLANARLSEKSARGYERFGPFARQTFSRISKIAAQTQQDAARFKRLGVPDEKILVTGSIKFDTKVLASVQEQAQVLRMGWGINRPVWVAASTHEGEDEIMLAAHKAILENMNSVLLVLVPRHPERFDRVAALAESEGLNTLRRSSGKLPDQGTQVFIGDTMGELPVFLGAADVAFFGGSLVPTGGHNMLEAAAQGVPVLFGPHTFNFLAISQMLLEQGGAAQVADAESLSKALYKWLSDASLRARIGTEAKRVVENNRGALEALTRMLEEMLVE